MSDGYLLGILLAFLSGTLHAFGAIIQKGVVNRMPAAERDHAFMRRLLRNPVWLSSFVLSFGLGTVFTLQSQKLIGPALNPGLSSAGMMITLTIGSAMLIGEKLKPHEILGIFLMIGGSFCLGYSDLGIPSDQVSMMDRGLLVRIAVFTLILGLVWLFTLRLAVRAQDMGRGLSLAVSGGFIFGLSNLWILPLLVTISLVFSGNAQIIELIVFILACIMLVLTNMAGIRTVQEAYKFAPASLVQPIQQVPTQTIPILIYFWVFQRSASGSALLFIPLGVCLILVSGSLLNRRKAEIKNPLPEPS